MILKQTKSFSRVPSSISLKLLLKYFFWQYRLLKICDLSYKYVRKVPLQKLKRSFLRYLRELNLFFSNADRLSYLRRRDRRPDRAQHRIQQQTGPVGRPLLLGGPRHDHHARRTLPSTSPGSLEVRLRGQHRLSAVTHFHSLSIS